MRKSPYLIEVAEEVSELAAVYVLDDVKQKYAIELEGKRVLHHELVHAIQELDKNLASLLIIVILSVLMAEPGGELMSEVNPVLIDEGFEALDCSEIRIKQDLRECDELGCSVPAVAAMNHHIMPGLKAL